MSGFAFKYLLGGIAAGVVCSGAALALNAGPPPDFSGGNTGWVSIGTDYVAMPGGPKPVTFDPAHRYVPNGSGQQPTFRVADLNNPVLTQFAKDGLKTANDMVLRGFAMYARESRCWMTGVPTYLLNPAQPTFILQEPKKITMMWQMDQQVRHIYMNAPHSANPKPSWYGESVGHYEGDTLVVDTIGMNDKTYVDNYRTPHTDKLRVVERFRLIDNGMTLEVNVHVEDPGAFTTPWNAGESHMKNRILEAKSSIPLLRRPASPDSKIAVRSRFRFENFSASCAQVFEIPYAIALPWNAVQRYRRTERGLLSPPLDTIGEYFCAENNINPFHQDVEPMPEADRSDF